MIMEQLTPCFHPLSTCLRVMDVVLSEYQYSEIVRPLMSVYFCGSCLEDVMSYLMRHLSYHPMLPTCNSDAILGTIRELNTLTSAHRCFNERS